MKLLYITSLSGKRINSFMRSAIVAAKGLGLDFVLACNMSMADKEGYQKDCKKYGIKTVDICFDRNPLSLKNITAYKSLLKLMNDEQFNIVQCNTPIGGLLGRLCAKKAKIKYVIYMAHGFHFWKGAPLKNWMLYYPIERLLAKYTDEIVTINEEDFTLAQTFLSKKRNNKVTLIHGVGVNTAIESLKTRSEIRRENKIEDNISVFINTGELIDRKNQLTLIKTFESANIDNSVLLICGDGENRKEYQEYIDVHNLQNKVKLLGFRTDVADLLTASDVFVFPSFQEGLPSALMEAMVCKKLCVASRIRGNVDLLGKEYKYLFDPNDKKQMEDMMKEIIKKKDIAESYYTERISNYSFERVVSEFKTMYSQAIQAVL